MAQDCLLLPSPDADLTIETTWADLAVKLGQNEGGIPWCYFCKGFAEYRQRRFGNAVDWTDKSLAREGKRPPRDVQACMVLAMAKYQLNQLYEARAVFARGVQIADHNLPKLKDGALDHRWINWLIAEALIREARALIEDEAGGE
jgi:hypothetical protein